MAIVPTGSPAWLRTADITSYGGDANKRNYLSQGVVDPTTDVGAEDFSRLTADTAANTRTGDFAVLVIQCNDTTTSAPTIESARMMTGVRLTAYTGDVAPAGFPSGVRNANGDVTIEFASSYLDEYGVSGAFSITDAAASALETYKLVTAEIVDATHVRIRCANEDGSSGSNARFTLVVG